MSARFPTVPPLTSAKVLDEKKTGRKKDGKKKMKTVFCSEGAKGLSVRVFQKKGFNSCELVSSHLTILCALWLSISITNTYDIIAYVV